LADEQVLVQRTGFRGSRINIQPVPEGTAENSIRLKCRTKIYDFETKIENGGLQEISNAYGIRVVNLPI